MIEKHKQEREALALRHRKELTDMKIRQEQERSQFKQTRYVKTLHEWMEEYGHEQGLNMSE